MGPVPGPGAASMPTSKLVSRERVYGSELIQSTLSQIAKRTIHIVVI